MSTMVVQIRNVPAALHRRLKARATAEGMSMSDFVLREVRKALDRPRHQEILERLRRQPERRLRRSPADVLRAERPTR